MANTSITVGPTVQTYDPEIAHAIENPYAARYATIEDAVAIDHVVRESFGSSAPKSSSARDMRRRNTTYIVATRGNDASEGTELPGGDGNGSISRRFKSIFTASVGGLEPQQQVSSVVGLVGLWTAVDQMHVVVIATRPSRRGRGVGELLLIATIAEAFKNRATTATLEVRKSNLIARSLYRKYGFSDVGIRHQYYHDNREDAIIMATPSFANLNYRRSLQRRCTAYFAARGRTELPVDPLPLLALPEQE